MTAAGTSIDVVVRPDPVCCSVTARQLSGLADACARAAALLARHAQTGEEQFGGLSGIVYRQSSGALLQACQRLGGRSRRLSEVQRVMDDAVAVATPHLVMGGGRIWSPATPAPPDDDRLTRAWAAWRGTVARWRAARSLEERVAQDWLGVLGHPVVIDDGEPPVLDLPLGGAVR